MRRASIGLFAAVSTVAFAQIASAADMPVKAAPLMPAPAMYNWSGWYIGGNVGYGWSRDTGAGFTSFTDPGGFGAASYFADGGNVLPGTKPKGVIGGAQIGYNWQISPIWVLGVVADIQASGMKDSQSAVTPPVVVTSTETNESKITWFGTARVKAGWAQNNWLFYGTGGLAYGGLKNATTFNCAGCSPPHLFAGSSSQTRAGWTVGAGVDYGLSRNWTVGAEYLYFDLGSISTTATLVTGTVPATFTSNAKFAGSIARVTFNYKFGP
jgi:outer membrane immunogenic protein